MNCLISLNLELSYQLTIQPQFNMTSLAPAKKMPCRRGHSWTCCHPLPFLPARAQSLVQSRWQVWSSPRLSHYYDRRVICCHLRCGGKWYWNYVTKASSPLKPKEWGSLVSVVVTLTSNVNHGVTVIHVVGAKSIISIVFFIHRCVPPSPFSRHRFHAPHRQNQPFQHGHIHSMPTPTPPTASGLLPLHLLLKSVGAHIPIFVCWIWIKKKSEAGEVSHCCIHKYWYPSPSHPLRYKSGSYCIWWYQILSTTTHFPPPRSEYLFFSCIVTINFFNQFLFILYWKRVGVASKLLGGNTCLF